MTLKETYVAHDDVPCKISFHQHQRVLRILLKIHENISLDWKHAHTKDN